MITANTVAKALFLTVLLLLSAAGISAQMTVLQIFEAAEPGDENDRIENLLYLSAGLALQDIGFSSTRREQDADYVLYTRYHRDGSRISISYVWEQASDTHERSIETNLDHTFEQDIASALRELIPDETDGPGDLRSEPRIELFDDSSTGEATLAPPPDEPDEPDEPAVTETEAAEAELEKTHYYGTFAIQNGFFLAESADFFRSLPGGRLSLGRRWSLKSLSPKIGLQISSGMVLNQAEVRGGPLIVSTIGPELGVSWKPWHIGSWQFRLSGGAAFLSLQSDNGFLHKTVAYTDGGIGYTIELFEHTKAGFLVHLRGIFDQDFPLITVAPELYVKVNWNHEKN